MSRNWIITGVSAVCLVAGVVLSHRIEPGIRVEKIMLATNTPALRIFPATLGPHPIALLAHGNGGSKEMLFRFGEALAAAGFDCYSVDQAGFGKSLLPVSLRNIEVNLGEAERSLGAVDVFVGHSMGGEIGAWTVRRAIFRPQLFVGVGDPAKLGQHAPPLLLLGGLFEEFFRPAQLRARTDAEVVISPWSDHLLEPYDPVLVNAAVKAACAAVDKPVPAAPTAWRCRLAGLVLGIASALGLMLYLPELNPRLGRIRRFIVPGVLLLALVLTLWPWWGMTSQLRRIPAHFLVLAVVWLALIVADKLRMPRWSLPVVTGFLALGCIPLIFSVKSFFPFSVVMCALAISTLWLLPAVAVGRIATRGGSRRDGDIAMAIFASYVIGQFMPLFY
jgi:hypothetical protein